MDKNASTGEWAEEVIHGSRNPEDYIYGIRLNDLKNCPKCHVTMMEGKPCKYAYCYATVKGSGAGNCGKCERRENARFLCCRRKYREYVEALTRGPGVSRTTSA
jgi:hypothetical protein